MYCSKCGVQNSDGSTHCTHCGSILMDVAEPVAGPAQSAVMQTGPKTCGLAVAAFVMGLLSMTCILWPILVLPAIICGIVALVKISKNKPRLKGTGLAVTGIVIPAVMVLMIPVIAILLAIMMPALSKVKHIAQKEICLTNIKGLSIAMQVYTNDYDDMLPTENWCDLLIEEADVSPKSFVCPDSDVIEGESSYAMNKHIAGKELSEIPANIVLFFETDKGKEDGPRSASIQVRRYYEFIKNERGTNSVDKFMLYPNRFNQLGGPEDLVFRHEKHDHFGCNIAFADGHTEFVTEDRIAQLKWTAE